MFKRIPEPEAVKLPDKPIEVISPDSIEKQVSNQVVEKFKIRILWIIILEGENLKPETRRLMIWGLIAAITLIIVLAIAVPAFASYGIKFESVIKLLRGK